MLKIQSFFISFLVIFVCSQADSFGYRIMDEDDQVFIEKNPQKQAPNGADVTKRLQKAPKDNPASLIDSPSGDGPLTRKMRKTSLVDVSNGHTVVSVNGPGHIHFGIGFYGGSAASFGFLGSRTDIALMLRIGMDFRLNAFYWALEAFGNLGAEAGHILNHEFIVGGNIKFGVNFGFGKWMGYVIFSPQYEDLRGYDGKYVSLGVGCGLKVKILSHISVFFEQKIMFKASRLGNDILNERPFAAPYMAVGVDFYV